MDALNYQELRELHDLPFFELLSRARAVHVEHWPERDVQLCTLLSVKTGKCPEDCSYCAQSVRFDTPVEEQPLMDVEAVRQEAILAQEKGAQRFCMGAGWRSPKDPVEFEQVLDMVREVKAMGMEACVTLGMLSKEQALQLRDAGLTAYNHNLDTSEEFYPEVITTRRYEDRLDTLRNVAEAGVGICSGGILGLGESVDDRLKMLETLGALPAVPQSIPINQLVPIPGTPLAEQQGIHPFDVVRMIAVTRMAFPQTRIRLSAGRESLSDEAQALAFFAGANSVFYGDRLLTTDNNAEDQDRALIESLGLQVETTVVEPNSIQGSEV
ncbi:MAG: biotin synthase BioB [Planctomycetota bacterium]